MSKVRKTQFWLDNGAGMLTEYTDQINSAALNRAVDILETTALNDDDRQVISGVRSFTVPLNGMYEDTSVAADSIAHVLEDAQGTSVSKTFQYKIGAHYRYGECFPAGVELSSDGKEQVVWSATLEGSGGVTRTSVSQAA